MVLWSLTSNLSQLIRRTEVKYIRALGCITTIYVSLAFNVNAATAQYTTELGLTNLQYQATINGVPGDVAANISRFDLGAGWDGEMDIQVTSDSYNPLATTLGFALTTNPNDTLLSHPDTFFQLAEPNADVTQFFDDNVEDWVMYGWGYNNLPPGEANSLTDSLNLQFDPGLNYYAFIAGGSTQSTTVSVSVDISDGNEVNPVPLPAAVWFFGSGLIGLLGVARRKLG
jgi:hypothetical protein